MRFFSRRKDPKAVNAPKNIQADEARSAPPILRLNVSGQSLPELGSSAPAAVKPSSTIQRPCLKRATKSENSMYLTMYAANNRLARSDLPGKLGDPAFNVISGSSSRSSSRTRPQKQVSFKLDNEDDLPRQKLREPLVLPKRGFSMSTPSLPTTSDESDVEDWHDAKSISSTDSLASSLTSVDFELAPIKKSGAPMKPATVAAGFERRMSKLPPVSSRDSRPRPKISLAHTQTGQPSWTLKNHRQSLVAV